MSEKERIQVVDHEYTFSMIDNSIIKDTRLTAFDRAVYMALKFFAGQKNTCWPSGKTISEYSGCGRSTVFKALAHLEELCYISRTQRAGDGDFQKTTFYQLNAPQTISDENVQSPCDGLSVSASRTAGVHLADGGCPPDGHELDSRTILNEPETPCSPPSEELPDESPLPEESDPSEADTAAERCETDQAARVEELFRNCTSVFPGMRCDNVSGSRLRSVLSGWLGKLGETAVSEETGKALNWLLTPRPDEKGRLKKPDVGDAVAFYDDWLKSAADDANFEKWWALWPGVSDGYEKARAEWRSRLKPLRGEARAVALRCLFDELERLRERAGAGAEIEYLPRARTVIRDAKLDALPEVGDG